MSQQNWIIAGVLLICFFFFGFLSRKLVVTFTKEDSEATFFSDLSGTLRNVFFVLGLKIFFDSAPFPSFVLHYTQPVFFVLLVMVISQLARQATIAAIHFWSERAIERKNPQPTSEIPKTVLPTILPSILKDGYLPLLQKTVTIVIYITALTFILNHFGYDILSLVTALGVGSLALGLASKDTLSNMISGFTLIIDKNLVPGNRINVSGMIGLVEEIGLRSTRIKLGNGNLLIVPNSELANTKILNLSMPTDEAVVTTVLRVQYSIPFEGIKKIIEKTIKDIPQINTSQRPSVHLASLTEGFQKILVSFWIFKSSDQEIVLSEFNENLMLNFQKEKIPLVPFTDSLASPI